MGDAGLAAEACWSVYIVRCGDGSLYTGIAKDVGARLAQHNSGRGAAYTRSRRPVELLYSQEGMTRSEALVREAAIKKMPRDAKSRLAGGSRPA
jgi:predicted GIY-YIG superfamily endonuclease